MQRAGENLRLQTAQVGGYLQGRGGGEQVLPLQAKQTEIIDRHGQPPLS